MVQSSDINNCMVYNCPNCGAPMRNLTGGRICEYCGTEHSFMSDTPFFSFVKLCNPSELTDLPLVSTATVTISAGTWNRRW